MQAIRSINLAARAPSTRSVRVQAKGKTSSGQNAAPVEEDVQEYLMNMPGISNPFPNVFDPAGFTNNVTVRELKRYRESEVTHGRVAMLAALGFIIGEQLEDVPALLNFDGGISGVPAIYQFQRVQVVRPGFWESLVVFIGLCETYRVAVGWATPTGTGFNALKDEYNPGELGFDPLGLLPEDPEELKTLQTKELNNGRLAMVGIAGFVAQELVLKQEIFEHLALRMEREIDLEIDDISEAVAGIDLVTPVTIPL